MFSTRAPDVRHPGDVERIGVGLLGARGGGLQDGTMRQHSAAAAGQHIPLFLAHGLAAAHPPHDARWGAVDGDRRQRPCAEKQELSEVMCSEESAM